MDTDLSAPAMKTQFRFSTFLLHLLFIFGFNSSCDDNYSGDSCETQSAQWLTFTTRMLTNDVLVWYKTTTVAECQKRCTMDWTGTATPCVGISFRASDSYCYLYSDVNGNGNTLEADDDYTSYIPYYDSE